MTRGFVSYLSHITASIDIVEEDTFRRILDHAATHLFRALNITHIGLAVEREVDRRRGLEAVWRTGFKNQWVRPLKKKGVIQGHMAYALLRDKPLWIVDAKEAMLTESEEILDLWSRTPSDRLPPFGSTEDVESKTSIVLPLRDDGRPMGAMAFESPDFIPFDRGVTTELTALCEALEVLVPLQRSFSLQSRNTDRVLRELGEVAHGTARRMIGAPRVFLGYGHRARTEVRACIKRALKSAQGEVKGGFEIVDWAKQHEGGNITELLLETLSNCQYAVCYLSEPSGDSSGPAFGDNLNVLYEAGVLQGLKHCSGSPFIDWVPVREEDSPAAPFDFRNERMVVVPKSFDEDLLYQDVYDRVATWFG